MPALQRDEYEELYEEIRQYFNLPIREACKRLDIGETQLKKHCRKLGISVWPYRAVLATQEERGAIMQF